MSQRRLKDSAITSKIKTKLAAEHIPSLGRIHVDTDKDGVVWLSEQGWVVRSKNVERTPGGSPYLLSGLRETGSFAQRVQEWIHGGPGDK